MSANRLDGYLAAMHGKLTDRKEVILKIVVDEYIRTGAPVPSADARFHALRVSPATIRNELAWLKQEGYLVQPHTSAGSVPSDLGYRYYVNSLLDEVEISAEEQRLVRHMFHQVETDLEEWITLAASMLSQLVHNAAFVVPPKSATTRLKALHLISLQELIALLVLVFQDGRLRRQLITFDAAIAQDELDRISNKLNLHFAGLTRPQVASAVGDLGHSEQRVVEVLLGMMAAEDDRGIPDPQVEGLRNLLAQPEFARGSEALSLVELLETRALLKPLLTRGISEDVRVIIGEENKLEALQALSLVVSGYGADSESRGAVGVIGPRRMSYSRSIASVRFLASLLGQLGAELRGTAPRRTDTPER